MSNSDQMRIGVMQRVLPAYRVPLFDALAAEFGGRVSVFAGAPRKNEVLAGGGVPHAAKFWRGRNYHIFSGKFYLCWQAGLLDWLEAWQPRVLIMEANPRCCSEVFSHDRESSGGF